ncbi:MAG: hypothetical protein P1U80_00325 [Pseudomonadales bacterium]|nr:hypothetical protein [Pseudomonadales bacterium]
MSDVSLGIGVSGIQAGVARADRASSQIASAQQLQEGGNNTSLVESLVELKTAQNEVAASAKVVEAASNNQGSIIDIMV